MIVSIAALTYVHKSGNDVESAVFVISDRHF